MANQRIGIVFASGEDLLVTAINSLNVGHAVRANCIFTSPGEYTIPLSPNLSGENRQVDVIYGIADGTPPIAGYADATIFCGIHKAGSYIQDHKSHRLNNGSLIAKSNIINSTSSYGIYLQAYSEWTTAMGIEDTYLTQFFFSTTGYTYSNFATLSGSLLPIHSCEAYSEPEHPGVTWRLPTLAELQEMYDKRETIGGFIKGSGKYNGNFYWSIEEPYNTNASIFPFETSSIGSSSPTTVTEGQPYHGMTKK